jgi:hypothetical protein
MWWKVKLEYYQVGNTFSTFILFFVFCFLIFLLRVLILDLILVLIYFYLRFIMVKWYFTSLQFSLFIPISLFSLFHFAFHTFYFIRICLFSHFSFQFFIIFSSFIFYFFTFFFFLYIYFSTVNRLVLECFSENTPDSIRDLVLHYIAQGDMTESEVRYCIVLYCIVLYCIVLFDVC